MLYSKYLKFFAIGFGGLLVVGGFLYWIFMSVIFRIAQITPDVNAFPTSSDSLSITFTKELAKTDTTAVSTAIGSAITVSSWSLNSKVLTIKLSKQLKEEETLVIDLKNITAKSGDTLNTSLTLVGKYVDFAALPEEEQEKQIKESNSFDSYEITSNLPMQTDSFEIDYRLPDSGQVKMPLYITVINPYPSPDSYSSAEDVANYDAFTKSAQEAAYKALIALPGYSKEYYYIYYSEPVLGSGLEGSYVEQLD